MPTIFVATQVLVSPPDDANDGLDIYGLQALQDTAAYTPATRTLFDPGFANAIPDLTGCWVAVSSGTNWTKGLYQIESCDVSSGTLVFKAATGVNTTSTDIPTLSSGPLATISAALALAPATPTSAYTSYAANAAIRIGLALASGTIDIASTLQISVYGVAAYHNRVCPANPITGQIDTTAITSIRPSGSFTAGTPLVQLVTGTNPYYLEFSNITFNGTANGRQASHCFDANTGNGDVRFHDCRFTGGSGNGLRVVSQRVQVARCLFDSNLTHGIYTTSSANNSLRVFGCESHSNTSDGFNIESAGEGASLIECVAHNNGRDGFAFASSNRSTNVHRCVAANNTQHGFNMGSGVDLCVRGCVSAGNGSTSSHRQFSFGTTTSTSRVLTFEGNAAYAAGSTVATDATDLSTAQLTTVTSTPIRSTAASSFDGRLLPALRRTLGTLIAGVYGLSNTQTTPPGFSQLDPPGSSGDQRVLLRP